MKKKIVILLALTSLVFAFALILAAPHKANASAIPTASALPATPAAVPSGPHPQIHEAIASLRRAKEHLEHASHDFGGHREEAIRAIDESIRQLEICLKY